MNSPSSPNVSIRKFIPADKDAVRRISRETAFLEEPWQNFIDDGEVLADALTLYYTDYEPQSAFVAVIEGQIIGYIIGSTNVIRMRKVFERRIFPKLFGRVLLKGTLFKRNSARFLRHLAVSFWKGEFALEDFSKDFPATLHINIDKNFRHFKIGRRLIETYLDFLRQEGIPGVHFGTMSQEAKGFFVKLGFQVLFEGRRSYLRYYFKRDFSYSIFGKLL